MSLEKLGNLTTIQNLKSTPVKEGFDVDPLSETPIKIGTSVENLSSTPTKVGVDVNPLPETPVKIGKESQPFTSNGWVVISLSFSLFHIDIS